MMDLFFSNGAGWFSVPAIVGSVVVLARLLLMMLGGDLDSNIDIEGDLGGIGDGSDALGQYLSIQAVSAFLMGFGWAGLACFNGFSLGWTWSMLVGLGFGTALTVVQAWLFAMAMGLQGSRHIDIDEAVGVVGEVTVTVPAVDAGRGAVRVIVGNTQKEYNAVSNGEEIARGTAVRVIEIRGNNIAVIEPAE